MKGGLTVQELKQMTALRMAQSQEYTPHSSAAPVRNDMVYASAASGPQNTRFAPPALDIYPRSDVRHENRQIFSDDSRREAHIDKRQTQSLFRHQNHSMQLASQPPPSHHNHSAAIPVQHGNIPQAIYQSPLRSVPPVLSKSPARRMKSPSTIPTPVTPVTPTTPTSDVNGGSVPHALTVQELKELTRRRLAREAVVDGRPGGGTGGRGSTSHSREGSVCSNDELSLTADFFDKSSVSGGSGGTDREVDTFSDLLMSSLSLKPVDAQSPRISPLHMLDQFHAYPPINSSLPPPAPTSFGSVNGGASRSSAGPVNAPLASGIHPGLSDNYASSRAPPRDWDANHNQTNSGLRKLALNNANREGGPPDDTGSNAFRPPSPPSSPRSLRNRPKLAVSYPEPLHRMRSTSSDYGSSIPIEAAESVLLTPTPCSPSTPRHMSKYLLDHRLQQKRESVDIDAALLRSGSHDQSLGMLHGLAVLRHDDFGPGAGQEAWYAAHRQSAPYQDNSDQFTAASIRSQNGYGHSNGLLVSIPVGTAAAGTGQSASVSPTSDVDKEVAALDDNVRRGGLAGVEPTTALKSKSFSPIFLYDTSGPFSYTEDTSADAVSRRIDSPMASFEQDLAPLLTSALFTPGSELGPSSSSSSSSRLNTYQRGSADRSRLFP